MGEKNEIAAARKERSPRDDMLGRSPRLEKNARLATTCWEDRHGSQRTLASRLLLMSVMKICLGFLSSIW
jgi:hypothetical protein